MNEIELPPSISTNLSSPIQHSRSNRRKKNDTPDLHLPPCDGIEGGRRTRASSALSTGGSSSVVDQVAVDEGDRWREKVKGGGETQPRRGFRW